LTITEQQKKISELEERPQSTTNTRTAGTLANLVENSNRNNESDFVIFSNGVGECDSEVPDEKEKHDKEKVHQILNQIGITENKCKRIARIKPRTVQESVENSPAKEAILLVELQDCESKNTALSRSRELSRTTQFKGIFINKDRTIAERKLDKVLRDKKKERNSTLPHIETNVDGRTLRYKRDEVGNRW
ncbi:hypothetical protein BpHYR1_054457, partial [Brachionus plicatilis]